MGEAYDYFFCHVGKDIKPFLINLRDEMMKDGLKVFLDTTDAKTGEENQNMLFGAITNSSKVAVFLTENFFRTKWALKELDYSNENKKNLVIVNVGYPIHLIPNNYEHLSTLSQIVYKPFQSEKQFINEILFKEGHRKRINPDLLPMCVKMAGVKVSKSLFDLHITNSGVSLPYEVQAELSKLIPHTTYALFDEKLNVVINKKAKLDIDLLIQAHELSHSMQIKLNDLTKRYIIIVFVYCQLLLLKDLDLSIEDYITELMLNGRPNMEDRFKLLNSIPEDDLYDKMK